MKITNEDGSDLIYEHCKTKTIKKPYIEIGSLEQLMELIKDVRESIVVDEDNIIIYDYYLE